MSQTRISASIQELYRAERIKEHPTTYCESLMHVLKANVGTGLFAMGDAMKNSGIILGAFLIAFIGILCLHCEHILLKTSTELKNELNMDEYPDFATTVNLCFSNGPQKIQKYATCVQRVVNVFLCVTQLGFCCVYIVFVASTTVQLLSWYGYNYDVRIIMCLIVIPIALACLIRNLKYLAPISAMANVFLLLGAFLCLYYVTENLKMHETAKYVAKASRIPLFFGTALFAFAGIGTVIPIKVDMKHPESFNSTFGVLNIAKFTVLAVYIIMGVLSYMKYGEGIEGSVTLNIPKDEILAQTIKGCTGFAIMFTYPIQYYVPYLVIWIWTEQKQGPFIHPIGVETGVKLMLVMITLFLALAVPYLDLFISLVGAISSSALELLVPPTLECVMALRYERITAWLIIKDIIIFIVGILGTITGTIATIMAIVKEINTETDATSRATHWITF